MEEKINTKEKDKDKTRKNGKTQMNKEKKDRKVNKILQLENFVQNISTIFHLSFFPDLGRKIFD